MVVTVTDDNFKEVVLQSDKPVLVDFWATWCGPCRVLSPILDGVAKDIADAAIVVKANIDENSDAVAAYGIRNVPAMLFFKNGEVMDQQIGLGGDPKTTVTTKLTKLL